MPNGTSRCVDGDAEPRRSKVVRKVPNVDIGMGNSVNLVDIPARALSIAALQCGAYLSAIAPGTAAGSLGVTGPMRA